MNIKKIEEVINLVKSNGVKRFKFKDNKSELELDFTEGYQSSNVSSNQNLVSTNTVNDESLQQVQRVQVKKLLKKSLHQWWVLSSYKIVKN